MRISIHDPKRIELIPENNEEKAALNILLDRREHLMVWHGDAGENFDPPEMLTGVILGTYYTPPLTDEELMAQEQNCALGEYKTPELS